MFQIFHNSSTKILPSFKFIYTYMRESNLCRQMKLFMQYDELARTQVAMYVQIHTHSCTVCARRLIRIE